MRRIIGKYTIIGALFLGVGFFIGSRWTSYGFALTPHSTDSLERRAGTATFINPLLDCTSAEADFSELKPFQDKVTALIADRVGQGKISSAAVYFRDLNNGPWFGINETQTFAPSSLLKVPLAMAYYNYASASDAVFNQEISWTPDPAHPLSEPITIQANQPYTVREMIRRMLVYSDNAATYALFSHIPPSQFSDPYNALGIPVPDPLDPSYQISIMGYSKFFRVLYNASYADRHASQEILQLLSSADFTQGLRAGVPSNIPVSHKFGERAQPNESELHDCGIIYYPTHPYILCVMSRGSHIDDMAGVIRDISSLVYHEVNQQISQ